MEDLDFDKLTPAMKQYAQLKKDYPDCIILFRMGDFYECFYEDAKLVAKELEITLTGRGKGDGRAPLAGIPFHSLDSYLPKLIKRGYKVAICEQIEDPKNAKGRLVKRDIVRIITPGTAISSSILDEKSNNYIFSIFKQGNVGIAIVDVSTGLFLTTEVDENKLFNEITKFNPSEIIIPESLGIDKEFVGSLRKLNIFVNYYPDYYFQINSSKERIIKEFNVLNLECFGINDKELCIRASGAILEYLNETQKTKLTHLNKIKFYSVSQYMVLDRSTIRNLELVSNIKDNSLRGSLLNTLDKTITPMGGRLLRSFLVQPLIDVKDIDLRLDAVEELIKNTFTRHDIKALLNNMYDIERLITKVNYLNANPRDLLSLKNSLAVLPKLKLLLLDKKSVLLNSIAKIDSLPEIVELIDNTIREDAPITVREGNMIKSEYDSNLKELHSLMHDTKTWIANLEQTEKEKTGISTLRISYNNVFGYYIEVTHAQQDKVPSNYIRKQTTKNTERYITEEMKLMEEKILGAQEKAVQLEYEIFMSILEQIKSQTLKVQNIAKNIALLDCLISLSEVAVNNRYVRPNFNTLNSLSLIESRHPVVEEIEDQFIPNDVTLSNESLLLIITGPNMSGKSTVMRQVALIQLMAQIGSFVPAKKADLSIVDRIFTRVGAYDDLTMGQSTFMVEMNETANILNNATHNSLVILDEIGRGTSTFDGISLAWAIAEYIHDNIKAKTLFATHYHQLNKLKEKCSNIKNFHVLVREQKDDILFLHKIVEGGTDKSYGIQVAKLAGVPKEVIERSKEIMNRLEFEDEISERIHSDLKSKEDFDKQKTLLNL